MGPRVLPGTYTLKFTAGGKTQTQSLTVRADPRTRVPSIERDEQLKAALALRDDVAKVARMVNAVRSLNRQITASNELLKDDPKAEPVVKMGKELVGKLEALEGKLHNPKARIMYDLLAQKGGAKLYSQLNHVYYLAIESQGAPTQGLREAAAEHRKELHELESEFKALTTGDLARLNELAKKLDVAGIRVPPEKAPPAEKKEPISRP
jgi:hypothetical protein